MAWFCTLYKIHISFVTILLIVKLTVALQLSWQSPQSPKSQLLDYLADKHRECLHLSDSQRDFFLLKPAPSLPYSILSTVPQLLKYLWNQKKRRWKKERLKLITTDVQMNVEMSVAWAGKLTVITPHCIFVCSMCCAPVAFKQWAWLHYTILEGKLKLLLPDTVFILSCELFACCCHMFFLLFLYYLWVVF